MLRNFVILITLTGFIFAIAMNPTVASTNNTASFFIEKLGNEGVTILHSTEPSTVERTERFRELFLHNFDIQAIGRFVLGRYWRSMSSVQKTEYKQLFEEYIITTYTALLDKYVEAGMKVKKESPATNNNVVIVYSFIDINSDTQLVPVLWKVQKKNGFFKILDVTIAGISLVIALRSEFTSIINKNGRNIDTFLDILRKKIKK